MGMYTKILGKPHNRRNERLLFVAAMELVAKDKALGYRCEKQKSKLEKWFAHEKKGPVQNQKIKLRCNAASAHASRVKKPDAKNNQEHRNPKPSKTKKSIKDRLCRIPRMQIIVHDTSTQTPWSALSQKRGLAPAQGRRWNILASNSSTPPQHVICIHRKLEGTR